MNLSLISHDKLNIKGMTIVEVMAAITISVMLISCVLGSFVSAKHFFTVNITGQLLQRDANNVMNKIIKGKIEPGGAFRLSEAVSYSLLSISELHFVGTDGNERQYRLSNDGRSVIYRHLTAGGVQDEAIYTAPAGRTITLRFWIPAGASLANIGIGIDLALSQAVRGLTVTGSVTTMINIRNHTT